MNNGNLVLRRVLERTFCVEHTYLGRYSPGLQIIQNHVNNIEMGTAGRKASYYGVRDRGSTYIPY